MTKTNHNWLKRTLALLLAVTMTLALGMATVAEDNLPSGYRAVKQLKAPVPDGVYYADINLMHATQSQYSMGNTALRGSASFLAKNPSDTEYKPIVIVKDGKATAIVEFMPMGYLGMGGFLLELEAVQTGAITRYGGVAEAYATYTPSTVLAQHRTVDGKVVYDSFNDPASPYVFDGSNPSKHTRPAGFGYSESRLVNISDVPYSHILALDVTPIEIDGFGTPSTAEDFEQENAAYVHVFVPVMFSISPTSGDQYAKLQVNWTTLKKIDDPTTCLYYQLYTAKQILEQDNGTYTRASVATLETVVEKTIESLANIWPAQQLEMSGSGFNVVPKLNMVMPDEAALLKDLNAAIDGLEELGDKSELNTLIEETSVIDQSLYTDETVSTMKTALNTAKSVQNDSDAGVSAIAAAVSDLRTAISGLIYKDADYSEVQAAIHSIPENVEAICTAESAKAVTDAKDAVDWTKNITQQTVVDGYAVAIKDAVSQLVYLGADYTKVTEAIGEIPADLSIYTDDTASAVKTAQDAVDYTLNITKQSVVDGYAEAIQEAISKLVYKPGDYTAVDTAINNIPDDLSVYTEDTVATVNAAVNAVVRDKDMSEQDIINEYAQAINDAVEALEYRSADYAKVDNAIQTVPSDLSLYTDETVKAVNDAIRAVEENKKITEQEAVDAFAKAIEDAVAALTYRNADYTNVEKALESVPADLSSFTEKSVKAVNDAVDALVHGKNITEQAAVDAMARAIIDAVSGLKKKDGALDKNNLEDGVYSVYGEMIKVNRQEKSMSNDAINHTLKLTVRDGQYYITINFHGISYLNRFGYLGRLSYYDNGFTYGEFGKIEGTLLPATVLSTHKNADGSDVTDEFNQKGGTSEGLLYPELLEFPIVADALVDADGYIPLHVFVPVMEDISEGTGDQDVLLKLDWSTLKITTEDDPGFTPEGPVDQSPAVDLTDAATGVKVHADKGVFEEGIKMIVTEITSGAEYDKAAKSLEDVGKKFKLYEIHFEGASGNHVQPNGMVTVSYPINSDYDTAKIALYRINEDGSKTLIKGVAQNGYYVVNQRSFSTYALVNTSSTGTQTGGNSGNSASNPRTGDNSNLMLWFVLLAVSGGAIITLAVRSRKHKAIKGE